MSTTGNENKQEIESEHIVNLNMAKQAEASVCPSGMYSWRVEALNNWIQNKQKKGITVGMKELCEAGHLDQYHYLGLDSNEDISILLQLGKGMKVLDVGSGIGGPGRYIAWKTGCFVHGVDIQEELVVAANKVAKDVDVSHLCEFFAQDCTSSSFTVEPNEFDAFYSILVFLHIPRQPRLVGFQKIADAMKPSASFVIEDYVLFSADMTAEEKHLLHEVIGAIYVPTVEEYRQQLEGVGFVDVEFEDLSSVWTKWTELRRDRFIANREKQIQVQGEEHVVKMETFYKAPPALFATGKLGGMRITGRKPENTTLAKGRELLAAKKKTNDMTLEEVAAILDGQKTVAID